MTVWVKCPECQKVIKLKNNGRKLFRHCGSYRQIALHTVEEAYLKPSPTSTEEAGHRFLSLAPSSEPVPPSVKKPFSTLDKKPSLFDPIGDIIEG